VFEHLIGWLRAKGIKSNKPLHDLRKEFGSLINQKHGLYAAAQALRHSDITTSARHYIARKERVTVGLGALLEAPGVQPPSVDRLESTAADGPKTNTTR
jgi:integrase